MMKKTEQQNQLIDSAEDIAYQTENSMEEIRNLLLASIISADNTRYSEEVKQEIIKRYKSSSTIDLEYLLEPLGKEADKYIRLCSYTKETA